MFCMSWNDCVNSLDFWNLPAKADFFAGFWNLPEKVRFFFCCDVCFLELLMMGSSVRVDFLSLVFLWYWICPISLFFANQSIPVLSCFGRSKGYTGLFL